MIEIHSNHFSFSSCLPGLPPPQGYRMFDSGGSLRSDHFPDFRISFKLSFTFLRRRREGRTEHKDREALYEFERRAKTAENPGRELPTGGSGESAGDRGSA
jgi:hypothetical protein